MTEFSAVTEKTVLDGTELVLGASSGDETTPQKFSRNTMNAQNGFINVRDYGALGEGYLGTIDDTAILAALAEAVAQEKILYFPPVISTTLPGYRMTQTLVVPVGIPVHMDGPIIRTTIGSPVIQIGAAGVPGTGGALTFKLEAAMTLGGNGYGTWDGRENCCIEVLSLHNCSDFFVVGTTGGHTGLRFETNDQPMGYNSIRFGRLQNSRIGLSTYLIAQGWFNQNRIRGSKIATASSTPDEDRWGCYFDNDGTQTINRWNANSLQIGGIELNASGQPLGATIPIYGKDISNTHFYDFRLENTNPDFIISVSGSKSGQCHYDFLNRSGEAAGTLIDQLPGYNANNIGSVSFVADGGNGFSEIWDSGHLPDKTSEHSGGLYTIEGMEFVQRFSSTMVTAGALTAVTADAITIHNQYLPVVRVDFLNDEGRVLRIRSKSPGDLRKRLFFWGRDANGDPISLVEDSIAWSTNGGWFSAANWNGPYYSSLSDLNANAESFVTFRGKNSTGQPAVDQVWIGWGENTVLSSWSIDALISTDTRVGTPSDLEVWKTPGPASDIPPTTLTYPTGKIIRNIAPQAGEYSGWVCTAGGTPGTWKGYGLVEA